MKVFYIWTRDQSPFHSMAFTTQKLAEGYLSEAKEKLEYGKWRDSDGNVVAEVRCLQLRVE